MNKKVLITIGVIIVIGLFAYSLWRAKSPTPPPPPPPGPTLTIQTPQGNVTINDITKNPIHQVTDDLVIAETPQYSIDFFPNEKSFSITLLNTPAQKARDAAEAAFLKLLGVDFSGACKLTVTTFVPADVDPNLAGTNYGLSFCPSGQSF